MIAAKLRRDPRFWQRILPVALGGKAVYF